MVDGTFPFHLGDHLKDFQRNVLGDLMGQLAGL